MNQRCCFVGQLTSQVVKGIGDRPEAYYEIYTLNHERRLLVRARGENLLQEFDNLQCAGMGEIFIINEEENLEVVER